MRKPIIRVKLTLPDVSEEPLLAERSWLLSGASAHTDVIGYFFGAPHLTKDASLGTHFANVTPRSDGSFELELGAVLPDLFPNLEGNAEYALDVSIGDSTREVCISNAMARMRFPRDGEPHHALIRRSALQLVRDGRIDFIPVDATVEFLRSVATSRYRITGTTAEEAFETHCEACIHDFIERLNRLLKVIPFVDDSSGAVYSLAYSRAHVPQIYFILNGEAEGVFGHGWISPHVGPVKLNPPPLCPERTAELRQYLSGATQINDIDEFIQSAKTFLDGGVLEYTLLLSVIAAEVATQRCVRKLLHGASVSNAKLKDARSDLKYSLVLNVMLPAVAPDGMKPEPVVLATINRARGIRNAYMHDGVMTAGEDEVSEIFQTTKRFVEYLRNLEGAVTGSV